MSIFLLRRSEDGDLRARLDDLENAHNALAREHEATRAELAENVALLTLLGIEPWLRDCIDRAKATGWLVTCSPKAIVFNRPEGAEHTITVSVPLSEDATTRARSELLARILCFERQRAAS